jgi:MoaA/NifB/PqqE/SkfB family radical SAM enzyme
MLNFPEIITLRITSRCNHNCRYCYGPKNIRELKLSELRRIFNLFHKWGTKAIVLTGGEPLIREDIIEIFKELKKRNFKIFLDTNGDFVFKYKNYIDSYVDVLGLPLDFSSRKFAYRDSKNFDNVLKILDYYKKKKARPILRIGTVVTKENINDLEKIAKLLKNYNIDIWKIYQFIPIGTNAVLNKRDLEIDTISFKQRVDRIKKKYSKYFEIVGSKRGDRSKAYFMIDPDGTVFMPVISSKNCKEVVMGKVFDKDIIGKWKRLVSGKNYIKNIKATFHYEF